MSENETKKVDIYETSILGFPVIIRNLLMVKRQGEWCPDINWKTFQQSMIMALITKPAKFIGGEILFIRTYFRLSMRDFAKILGVTAPAVRKWEKNSEQPTNMRDSTEKYLRSFILTNAVTSNNKEELKRFRCIMEAIINIQFSEKSEIAQIEASDLAA